MQTRMFFTINYFLTFLVCCPITSFCACIDAFEQEASTKSHRVQMEPQNFAALLQFPALKDVEYPPVIDDQSTDKYLTSLYYFNNECMNKVMQAIGKEQAKRGADQFNFVVLANDKELQKKVADEAKINEYYVQLYISRAIAWLLGTSESPSQKALKLICCKNFWNDNQRYILLSLLRLEEAFLCELCTLKEYISKIIFYSTKSRDFIWCQQPIFKQVAKKIESDHLPFTIAYMTKPRHFAAYLRSIGKILDEGCVNTQDYRVEGSKLRILLSEINQLSQNSDPVLRTLAFSCYYQIFDLLSLQACVSISAVTATFHQDLINVDSWASPESKKLPCRQIEKLIQSTKLTGNGPTRLLELFLDYHGLSMLTQMTKLFNIFEEIGNILSTEDKSYGDHTVDGIIAKLQFEKSRNQQLLKMLPRIDSFVDEYLRSYVPFESVFNDEFKKYNGKSIHPLFQMPTFCIFDERVVTVIGALIKDELFDDQSKCQKDQQTVDYLMQTYFPNEAIQQKNCQKQPSSKKLKKSKAVHENPSFKKQLSLAAAKVDEEKLAVESSCAIATPQPSTGADLSLSQPIVLRYHNRVLRWFDFKFAQLQEQESVIYHTLPPQIDTYLEREGSIDQWNGDSRYRLPAKITRGDGTYAYVICCCTLTKDGQIFHRGFEFSDVREIKEKFGIIVSEVNYGLHDDKEDPFIVFFKDKRLQNRSLLLDDNKDYVMLYDPINKLYVQLFHRQKPM